MSPFVQLVLLTVAGQLSGGLASYAKKSGAATGLTPEQVARYSALQQIGTNLGTVIKAGMAAAAAEFVNEQLQAIAVATGEKAVATAMSTLPPIT